MPIFFSTELAERIFILEKKPVLFIPLWKIVKNFISMILNYLLCAKLVMLSGIFFFLFNAAHTKLQKLKLNSHFALCKGFNL